MKMRMLRERGVGMVGKGDVGIHTDGRGRSEAVTNRVDEGQMRSNGSRVGSCDHERRVSVSED